MENRTFFKRFWWVVIPIALVVFGFVAINGYEHDKELRSANKLSDLQPEQSENIDLAIRKQLEEIDPENPPRFIQADFVELDKVFTISKFRSGMGHDMSGNSYNGETCRTLKHYFTAMDPNQPNYQAEGWDYIDFPKPSLEKDVKIFSPVDGEVQYVSFDKIAFDDEVEISPDSYPGISIRLMHVQAVPGMKERKVKAGELVGLVLANQTFDIWIGYKRVTPDLKEHKVVALSYFSVMPDSVFSRYQTRGVKSRDDLIFTKEFIDAHPWKCIANEQYAENYVGTTQGHQLNIVDLSGYDRMEELFREKYPNPKAKPDPNLKPDPTIGNSIIKYIR